MNEISSIIPFVFEDNRLRINNKPVLVPSSNPLGHVQKHQAFTLLTGKFNNRQDLLDTLHCIGLDIDPNHLNIKKRSYEIKYKDDISITVIDMYQDKVTKEFKDNYRTGLINTNPLSDLLSIDKP